MKNLIAILLTFTMVGCATAAQRVTTTLTVTNNPVYGDNLVGNSKTLNWTNSTAGAPSTSVLIGASIGASATNLYRQLASYPLSGPVNVGFSSSNILTFVGQVGQSMSFSMAGTWGTLSYSTNTIAEMNVLRVPASAHPTQSTATNDYSLAATALSTHSTNALVAGSKVLENAVQTTGAQTIAGNKSFTGDTKAVNLAITGSIDVTNAAPRYRFNESDAAADEKVWEWFLDGGDFSLKTWDDALLSDETPLYVSRSSKTITIDWPVSETLQFNSTSSNLTTIGQIITSTNAVTGSWRYTRANHTALANGNNAGVDFGTKVYAKVKAGPTAAFAINGITGGTDGRILIIDNSVAQNMTIANDSGVEPTAANRIYTRTGADITTTGQAVVTLIYDSEDSRWVVVSVRD